MESCRRTTAAFLFIIVDNSVTVHLFFSKKGDSHAYPIYRRKKHRTATVNLEEYLPLHGEVMIPSGRDKRLASDHYITVQGNTWYDHAIRQGGRPIYFMQRLSIMLQHIIHNAAELEELVQQMGFLPFFAHIITQFSIEEFTPQPIYS